LGEKNQNSPKKHRKKKYVIRSELTMFNNLLNTYGYSKNNIIVVAMIAIDPKNFDGIIFSISSLYY
jgi:hypothetical protein